MDIPKHASMIEVMQIGQLSEPYEIGYFSSKFKTPEERQKDFEEALEAKYEDQIKEVIKIESSRGGNKTGNDFLSTQLDYDGVSDPNYKKKFKINN